MSEPDVLLYQPPSADLYEFLLKNGFIGGVECNKPNEVPLVEEQPYEDENYSKPNTNKD